MNKNITILISVIFAIAIIGIAIWKINSNNNSTTGYNENEITNSVNLSAELVTDDCINEWQDYSETVQNDIRETSGNLNDENKHYILREKDGFINIYYINEDEEEILYKVTDISTTYLGEEDIKELKEGIEVTGLQNLNQLLEDFE